MKRMGKLHTYNSDAIFFISCSRDWHLSKLLLSVIAHSVGTGVSNQSFQANQSEHRDKVHIEANFSHERPPTSTWPHVQEPVEAVVASVWTLFLYSGWLPEDLKNLSPDPGRLGKQGNKALSQHWLDCLCWYMWLPLLMLQMSLLYQGVDAFWNSTNHFKPFHGHWGLVPISAMATKR